MSDTTVTNPPPQYPPATVVVVEEEQQGPPGPQGSPGAQGPPGAVTQTFKYSGAGPPPDVIVGAEPGDQYLNTLTGDIYKLV